jgi:ketosteroid isomerase-like protein
VSAEADSEATRRQALAETADEQVTSQRTIEERVGVRWPSMARRMMRWVLRLPPGSRVRRALLRRAARIIFLSWNRGDFALVPTIDDPEVETRLTVGTSRVAMGVDPVYYGPEGHCRVMEDWNEAWGEWDAEIDEIIEEGRDQVLFIARVYGQGAASGIKVEEWSAVRYTFREGRILRVEGALHSDRDRALDALGAMAG